MAGARSRCTGSVEEVAEVLKRHMDVPNFLGYSESMAAPKQPAKLKRKSAFFVDLRRVAPNMSFKQKFMESALKQAAEAISLTKWQRTMTDAQMESWSVSLSKQIRCACRHIQQSMKTTWCRDMLGDRRGEDVEETDQSSSWHRDWRVTRDDRRLETAKRSKSVEDGEEEDQEECDGEAVEDGEEEEQLEPDGEAVEAAEDGEEEEQLEPEANDKDVARAEEQPDGEAVEAVESEAVEEVEDGEEEEQLEPEANDKDVAQAEDHDRRRRVTSKTSPGPMFCGYDSELKQAYRCNMKGQFKEWATKPLEIVEGKQFPIAHFATGPAMECTQISAAEWQSLQTTQPLGGRVRALWEAEYDGKRVLVTLKKQAKRAMLMILTEIDADKERHMRCMVAVNAFGDEGEDTMMCMLRRVFEISIGTRSKQHL